MCVQRRFYGVVGEVNKLDRRRVFLTIWRQVDRRHHIAMNRTRLLEVIWEQAASHAGDFLMGENLTWDLPIGIWHWNGLLCADVPLRNCSLTPIGNTALGNSSGDPSAVQQKITMISNGLETPLPWEDLDNDLIRGFLGPSESTSQTAFRSVQLFFCRTRRSWPTDTKQTHSDTVRPHYVETFVAIGHI